MWLAWNNRGSTYEQCQECKDDAKSFEDSIQDTKNIQEIDDDNMLNIVPILQGVKMDLILADLKIPNDFSILQSTDIYIASTDASNVAQNKRKAWYFEKNKSTLGTMKSHVTFCRTGTYIIFQVLL